MPSLKIQTADNDKTAAEKQIGNPCVERAVKQTDNSRHNKERACQYVYAFCFHNYPPFCDTYVLCQLYCIIEWGMLHFQFLADGYPAFQVSHNKKSVNFTILIPSCVIGAAHSLAITIFS